MLNYRAPSWFYGEIKEFTKQMVVCELLLGQCCDGFLLSSQFHVCGFEGYKLYSGKRCILGEGKRLSSETGPPISISLAIAQY